MKAELKSGLGTRDSGLVECGMLFTGSPCFVRPVYRNAYFVSSSSLSRVPSPESRVPGVFA